MPIAVIVAGGLGTRARGMTGGRLPKALLEVAGVPIVFRQLRVLAREGIERVIVLAGHLGEALRDAVLPEAGRLGLPLRVTIERDPQGTAGSLRTLGDTIAHDDFLVVYGDIVFDLSLGRLVDFHRRHRAIATIVAHPNDHPETSDLLVAEPDGRLTAVLPSRHRPPGDYRNLVPAGLYACRPGILRYLSSGEPLDFVTDLFPALLRAGETVYAYNTPEYLRDMGTPDRLALAATDLADGRVAARRAGLERPALFFDCDGVLNEEPGGDGVLKPEDVVLLPGAAAAVRRARDAGLLTCGVTNKPQVAKGLVSPQGLQRLLGRLETLLARDGAVLDRMYACPHHPDRGFPGEVAELKISCGCRKPAPGMLQQAMIDLPVAVAQSAIIGDSWRDIGAGHAAGVFAYGVRTGAGCRAIPPGVRPDAVFSDVTEAVGFALGYRRLAEPILSRLGAAPVGRRIVAVCGPARSGKSVLAHALARVLSEAGVRTLHVRLDDWIVPLGERRPGMDAVARNLAGQYREVITRLARGEVVSATGDDPATRAAGDGVHSDGAEADVIVLDGILAGHADIRDLVDVTVYRDIAPPAHHALLTEVEAQRAAADLVLPAVDAQS